MHSKYAFLQEEKEINPYLFSLGEDTSFPVRDFSLFQKQAFSSAWLSLCYSLARRSAV